MEVIFNKIPKNGRKYFTKGLLLKKSVDIVTADRDIKDYAHNMQPNTDDKISFEISTEEESLVFDTVIEPEDSDLGIVGLIRRDSDSDELDSDEAIQIEDLISSIQDELGDESTDDNPLSNEPEPRDESTDDNSLSNEPEPRDKSTDDNSSSNEPKTMEDNTNSDSEKPTDKNESVNVAPLPTNVPESVKKETNDLELTPYDQYTNANDIYQRVPSNYGVNEFAVESIKQDLGYKKDPSNKYETELNGFINNCLHDYGIKKIQSDYDDQLAKLKAQVLEKLIGKYNEITPANLTDEAVEKIAPTIAKLRQSAEQEKQDLKTDLLKQEKAEQFKQEKEDEIKVSDYRQKLASERAIALKAFNEKVEAQNKQKSLFIDQKMKDEQEEEKKKTLNTLVKQYNEKLLNSRSDIGHEFDLAVRSNYDQHNRAFTFGLKEILPAIKKKKIELQKQETADIAEARKRQAEIIKQRQKDEELRLKKRELDQRQHYNDLNQKALQQLPEAIKEALANQVKPIHVSVNSQNTPTENTSDTTESTDNNAITNKTSEPAKTVKTKSKVKKNKKVWTIIIRELIVVVIVGLAIALVHAIGSYNMQHLTVGNEPIKTKVIHHPTNSKKRNLPSKKTIKKSVTSKKAKINRKRKKNQVSELEKYSKYNSWATKRDFLNGLLGQKDVRSLAQISTKYPSKLASLYFAIANEDQYRMREAWLSMTVKEKQEASTASKQAIALAFYNIHDWQNGWLARYAY